MKKTVHIKLVLLASVALSSCSKDTDQNTAQNPLEGTRSATASWVRSPGMPFIYRYYGGGFYPMYYRPENYARGVYCGPEYTPCGMMAHGAKAAISESSGIASRGGSFAHSNPAIARGGFGACGESSGS